ncbi:MAG: GGDEF domain-containing protein [Wenzhouxiangella sp.]|jgi:diguanylate cyclase (GGDEF)-like protein|nr:GGDEF domain-containing protein [Wenzhouxiangella sp.]
MNEDTNTVETLPVRDLWALRLSILIGGLLIALFMIGDLQLVPESLTSLYFSNRAFVQLPLIALVLLLTFHPRFSSIAQPVFFVGILGLTYTNFILIFLAWTKEGFSFPYEGTLLYAFFGYFVLGLKFKYALAIMLLSTAGFLLLMLKHPVYGEYTFMNVGFVAGSLFIGVLARFRLDKTLDQLGHANRKLTGLSSQDALTGLLNRRAFQEASEQFFDLTRRTDQRLTVFMMDLDNFKQFNDRHGHQAGDEAIQWHSELMKRIFQRKTDTLGRYGGEEFIAVVFSQNEDDAAQQARQMIRAWRAKRHTMSDPTDDSAVGCSIGICQGNAQSFDSIDEMIRIADEALYCAKEKGKGRLVLGSKTLPKDEWHLETVN